MRQLDLTERLLRLRTVPVFRSMPTANLAPLAASLRSATFEKGDVLLREGEAPRSFFMVMTGAVTMRRRGHVIRTITAPGGVGFLSLLARSSGGTEATAEARTQTFELRAEALEEMFEDHFPALLGTVRWVAERLVAEIRVSPPPPYSPPTDAFDQLIGDGELGIVERIFLLRRTIAFRTANVNSLARLARQMKEVRLPAGATVWTHGEPAFGSYFVVKGKGELRGKNGWVQRVGPSYVVGGTEALAGLPRWNTFVTTEPVVLLSGNRDGFIDMFEDDLDAALQFLAMVSSFLLTLWDRRAEREAGLPPSSQVSLPTPLQPFTPLTGITPSRPDEPRANRGD